MKKQPLSLMLILTLFFIALTLGFFWGRNYNREVISLSPLPTEPRHNAVPVAAAHLESVPVIFPIDINSADTDTLCALPGIGDALARRIVEHRNANGSFSKPEELLQVEGIGPGKLESILDLIITGG